MNKYSGLGSGVMAPERAQEMIYDSPQAVAPAQPTSKLGYYSGGGMTNTVNNYAQNAAVKIQTRSMLKNFQNLMASQMQGAKAAYDDAAKTYGDDIKGWIPPPEMFVDEQTGSFMPYKYYQSFATGIKEYKKNQMEEKRTTVQEASTQEQMQYRTQMLGQGQERLGIAQQQLGVSQRQAAIGEANAMIGAKREVATEQHQKETESRQMKQDLRTQMTANQSQINQLRRSLTSYEVQADSKAQADILNEIKRTRSNYDNLLKEYKLVDRDENISDDAVSIAVQIQDYAQGIGDRPPWLKQIYSTAPSPGGIGGAAGGTIAGNPETASPEAKAIAEYAVNLGVPDNLIDLTRIEQNLATKPIEWLIQAYMEIAKNAKPVKSGTAKTEKSIGNK